MSVINPMSMIEKAAAAAAADLKSKYRNRVIAPTRKAARKPLRFELFHAGASVCSHKVRMVLAEKDIAYMSHDLNLPGEARGVPDNYRPSYVRLRLLGRNGAPLVAGYTGQSSVATEGFDPCVVPTLVDHREGVVITDSRRICLYLDEQSEPSTSLAPLALMEGILDASDIVDQTPHVAMLYGGNPDKDRRPGLIARGLKGIQDVKVSILQAQMEKVLGEPEMVEAYRAKIAKEEASKSIVRDPKKMRAIMPKFDVALDAFQLMLSKSGGPWIFGKNFTLADVMWSVSLYRMKWLGIADLWEGKPDRRDIAAYADRAFARPSFKAAVIKWPNANTPSPNIPESNTFGANLAFVYRHIRGLVS